MRILLKKTFSTTFAIITFIFTFFSEVFSEKVFDLTKNFLPQFKILVDYGFQENFNYILSRLSFFLIVWISVLFVYIIYYKFRRIITIKGNNFSIVVEYGDILKKKRCKQVIPFDECYTTKVGDENTSDINTNSICGKYLLTHESLDIPKLIKKQGVKSSEEPSRYKGNKCYPSGTIITNKDDLLLAFAKLDEKGKGRLSREEYLNCLNLLWKELENHNSGKDVCIPILGSGTTAFPGENGSSPTQQELLDWIIWSYKLSSNKIKLPNKLHIVCKKNDNFSINNIDGVKI